MTAQIILTNQLGIAVASDTTTTIGEKALQTSSKIVALPWPHRLAVLDSGRVFLAEIQGRFLLTEWVLSLTDPLPTVEAYVDSFADWVGTNAGRLMVDDAAAMEDVARDELVDLWNLGGSRWTDLKGASPETPLVLGGKQLDTAIGIIDGYSERNFKNEPYPDLGDGKLEELIASVEFDPTAIIDEFLESMRSNIGIDGTPLRDRLGAFVLDSLRRYVPSRELMRLNFTGYGSDEMFPVRAELRIRSIYGSRLRCSKAIDAPSRPGTATQWFPIAQQDAMADMLRGMSGERRSEVFGMATDLVDAMEKLDDDDKKAFRDQLFERFEDYFSSRFERFSDSTIRALSLPALAYFADMLVKIQSMRSEMQAGPISVGGPVESLTISRLHGVEWSRRLSTHTDDRTGEIQIGR